MRTVFQVVATMVVANAAVAYGADAKDAAAKIKAGAAATAADAKAKASDVATGAKAQAAETKATVKEAAAEATKKAEAQPAPAAEPATSPITEAKEMAKEAMASQAGNTNELAGTPKSLIIPESAALPESVLRFRAIYAGATSTSSYDSNANKVENGLKITANQSVAVLEYGITDRISAQLLVPYSLGGKVTVDDKDKFTAKVIRPGFEAEYGTSTTTAAATVKALVAGGQIPGLSAAYAANQATPQEIDLQTVAAAIAAENPAAAALPVLFAGVKIPAGANVKDFIDNKLRSAVADTRVAGAYDAAKKTAEDTKFQEGLGDVQLGAKYALSTVSEPWFDGVPLYTSIGAGVRFNTGKFKEAAKDGKQAAGRGTTDLGIRVNADYEPLNGVQLQLENQTELMLAKGKTYSGGKEVDYERDGMRQNGFSKLVVAPGTWIPAADFLMLNARYNWDNDAETKTDGKQTSSVKVGRSAQVGVGFDGLKLKLPVQLDYDYVLPAKSRNATAFGANVVTLKLFYKF
jgi:hypothetical protein